MIFVSVGTQFGFDRLVRSVDEWAQDRKDVEVFAQIADGKYVPSHIAWKRRLTVDQFDERFEAADVIVSHAGMGNIIKALLGRKPIIVLPRDFALGEHRNDHQSATARKLSGLEGCYFAADTLSLQEYLGRSGKLTSPGSHRSASLDRLGGFLDAFVRSS